MAKFLILFNSKVSAKDQMANATPEQMKASMEEWMKWRDEAVKTVKFDWGLPLQAVTRVSNAGVGTSDNSASGYAIMEGDSKETIAELLKSHPHLQRPEATIDVLEMISMPGM
jgi:hypothetical protein